MSKGRISEQRENFLKSFRDINERANVDPNVVDLLEAYSRLRVEAGKDIDFYGKSNSSKNKALNDFLRKNGELDKESLNFLTAYFLEMSNKGLVCVLNTDHLAHLLNTSHTDLAALAENGARNYFKFHISKKNGGKREILSPRPQLRIVQRKILDTLLHKVPLNNHAEGFRKKRSILTNAQRHTDKQIVVKLDLKDFFPTITASRVKGMFIHMGYPANVADMLTGLTTYRGRLPIGSPTSPVISNIICRRMDKRFVNLGRKMDFSYSRYADDLTFSSNNQGIPKLVPFIREILVDEGFEVNESKLRIMRNIRRQKVTGIVVNQEPNIAREELKKLRAVLYNCQRNGMRKESVKWARKEKNIALPWQYSVKDFRKSLLAKINYVKMVNPKAGETLLKKFVKLA
jgi:retron-type reverse transcriptase